GLTICKQLVTLLGGEISLESEAGRGSCFSFSIPFGIIKDYLPTHPFQGKTVLVLEKNVHNRRYLNNTLVALGCRCKAFANENDLFSGDGYTLSCTDVLLFNPNALHSGIKPFLDQIRSAKQKIAHRLVMIVEPFVRGYETNDVAAILRSPVRYEDLRNCLSEQPINQKNVSSIRELVVADKLPVQSNRFVLIVDDNRTNQLVAKAMLSESGYQADIASSGREAIRLVTRKAYDLLLMDCNMPEIDGFEATKRIRSLGGKASKVPILAMTATDNPMDIQRCFEVGMNGFLLKPLNLERLRQKLNEYFSADDTGVFEGIDSGSSFDPDNLANLQNAMGNKVTEIIDAFLSDTPNYLGQLQKHLDAEDWHAVKNIAHAIKGSARNLGANLFASICRELEDLCIQGKQPKSRVQYLFLEMRREYEKVEAILSRKRDSLVASNVSTTKPGTVLVVDDDRSTRLTIVNVLASSGLHVEQAVNGREAVDYFNKNNPDLVIMDAVMPVMDGFAACREIKSAIGGVQTPVLMITALENDESIEAAFKCGAADFIAKPINLSVLKMRVKRFLEACQSEQKVKQLAFIDGITDLPNRVAFTARLKQDIAHAKRNNNQLAILFIDIDHFKDVNDSLGHAAGDELLKKLAGRVSECVRGEDTLARLGGDEFVVVLGAINGPGGADTVASHILAALSTPFMISGREVFVSASIGIAIYPDDGKNREILLKNADTAMYRAKATGRNNYQFYTLEMSVAISERIELEADLRKVLKNNELLLYYQPKVELLTGDMVGAEALVRWQHPTRGFLSPTEFISVADDAGLLNEIGYWVMTAACTQFEKWRLIKDIADGIAVNISARQLMSPGFVDDVRRCLEQSHLPPQYLELEITENTILENADETIEKLKQLRGMGIKIAIDDFGVGYSSFSYLKHMPVNVLKIDRGFVQDIPNDSSANAIVNGMINLAHNLDLLVVAEGVENAAQYRFLKDHDCDVVQGYFLSKPIPANKYSEKFIENNRVFAHQNIE
ncbi:MAG: EAL domain-containing protein, partial [Methylococcales bacterium]